MAEKRHIRVGAICGNDCNANPKFTHGHVGELGKSAHDW